MGEAPQEQVSISVNTEKDPGKGGREVDTSLTIERDKNDNALDIELDIVIDPESDKPMKVKIEAEVDNEGVEVHGEAAGKEKGIAHIEAEMERKGEPLKANEIDLNIEEKDSDSNAVELL